MRFSHTSGSRPLEGYTIKRGVGVGGFGEVYFATSDAGKEVALKRIQRNLDVEVRGVTQCLNLRHPNLIALYDIKYDDLGEGWIVMEFVNGDSLKDVLDDNPKGLPHDEVDRWFRGIAAGVAYLHDHGIVHRDLKPGNIFRDESVVKIGDYGLSKFISCSRRSGQTESVGTFHYMAPEIGKGVYGKEIDIYALGVLLFELLTGDVPFEGESSQEIIMKHLTADPDLSAIPHRYRRAIERALFKDPAKRFSNVQQMLHALSLDGSEMDTYAPLPPVATVAAEEPMVISEESTEPIYINDDGIANDEIIFGPLVQISSDQSGGVKPPVVAATVVVGGEPIASALHNGTTRVAHWWHDANFSTPIKAVLAIGGVILLILNSQWLIPLAIVLGLVYLVYFGMRSLVMAVSRKRDRGNARPHRETPAVLATHWRDEARQILQRRPFAERMAELTGSLLMSAAVSGVTGLLMLMFAGYAFETSATSWSLFVWLGLVTVGATWITLVLGKIWEGSEGDPIRRRFVMLACGLALGVVAFGGADLLLVDLGRTQFTSAPLFHDLYPDSMFGSGGRPLLPAFMVFFGGLFVILRWWKQADPLRRSRLGLLPTVACVLWSLVLPLPQPWSFMLAASTSVAVQLSAPWVGARQRNELRQQVMEA